jgi:hypothetical protein
MKWNDVKSTYPNVWVVFEARHSLVIHLSVVLSTLNVGILYRLCYNG